MINFFKTNKVEFAIFLVGLIIIHAFFLVEVYQGDGIYDAAKAGQFGDLIGGYVGTIFLLLSIGLLYSNLKWQRIAIENASHESNYRIIQEEIKQYKGQLDSFEYSGYIGGEAIVLFIEKKGLFFKQDNMGFLEYRGSGEERDHYNLTRKLLILLMEYQRIILLFKGLIFDDKVRKFVILDIVRLYQFYYVNAIENITLNWAKDDPKNRISDQQEKLEERVVSIYSKLHVEIQDIRKEIDKSPAPKEFLLWIFFIGTIINC
jgi:hypothetical protein